MFPVTGNKAIIPRHRKCCLEKREVGCEDQHMLFPIYQLRSRGGTCPANISTMNLHSSTELGKQPGQEPDLPFSQNAAWTRRAWPVLCCWCPQVPSQGAGGACGAQEGSGHPAQGDTDFSSTQGLLSPTCSWAEGGEMQQTL